MSMWICRRLGLNSVWWTCREADLTAAMMCGADSIDNVNVLRAGGTP
jgi:hypothetical protein